MPIGNPGISSSSRDAMRCARLRPYFYNRGLLGDLSRVAARTLTAFNRATTGARDLAVGIGASIQTHGPLADWHPHLHLLVTDGGFRPTGSFVPLPLHDVATLAEGFRGAVLRLFVRRELLEEDAAPRRGPRPWTRWPRCADAGRSCSADLRGRPATLSPVLHAGAVRVWLGPDAGRALTRPGRRVVAPTPN